MSREIKRLNDLLRQELGHPPYAWKFSEDLWHWMRKVDPDTGKPDFNYRCICGLNRRSHRHDCALVMPEPIYIRRKLCLHLDHQWTLCKQIENAQTEEEFMRQFGTALPYWKTTWVPCDPVHLAPGETPTLEVTWEVIRKMREHRTHTAADWDNDAIDARNKADAKDRADLFDDIKDTAPAFGGIPGRKEHWTSMSGLIMPG